MESSREVYTGILSHFNDDVEINHLKKIVYTTTYGGSFFFHDVNHVKFLFIEYKPSREITMVLARSIVNMKTENGKKNILEEETEPAPKKYVNRQNENEQTVSASQSERTSCLIVRSSGQRACACLSVC